MLFQSTFTVFISSLISLCSMASSNKCSIMQFVSQNGLTIHTIFIVIFYIYHVSFASNSVKYLNCLIIIYKKSSFMTFYLCLFLKINSLLCLLFSFFTDMSILFMHLPLTSAAYFFVRST